PRGRAGGGAGHHRLDGGGLGDQGSVGPDARRAQDADGEVEQRDAGGDEQPAVVAGGQRVRLGGAVRERVLDARGRGGRDQREAEGAAHLEGGGDDPRDRAGIGGRRLRDGGDL